MNRSLTAVLIAVPALVFFAVIEVIQVIDLSRATRAVIIAVTTVVCVGSLVSCGVWSYRRSH